MRRLTTRKTAIDVAAAGEAIPLADRAPVIMEG
jgi:hypothetical protein